MFSKNVSVTCPYCGALFSIPVGANYQNAEALIKDKSGKSRNQTWVKIRYAPIRRATWMIFSFIL